MLNRSVRALLLSVVLTAGCLAAAVPAAAAPAPSSAAPARVAQAGADDFYVPPSPLPEGKPGDVIRSRPSSVGWPTADSKAKTWQVMYRSTNALGEPTAMVATVLVPKGADPAKTSVVAFGPGTQGPAFQCAPSIMIKEGAFYEQSGVNDLLTAGYAIAIPDYDGYRPEVNTSYVVGRALGPAMIDATRAAMRLPETGLSADAKVVFRGYSQGGGAAMWAGEMQPEYAPELKVVGVAAGGIPADLVQVGLPLNGKEGFGVFAYALIGLDNAYPELKLDTFLNDVGRTEFAAMEKNKCAVRLLNDYKNKSIEDFMTQSPVASEPWRKRYAENKLGAKPPKVPTFQYHATEDQLVAYPQGKKLRDTYCAAGVKVTWKEFPGRHIGLVYHGNKDVLAFINDRVNGVPATSNCAG